MRITKSTSFKNGLVFAFLFISIFFSNELLAQGAGCASYGSASPPPPYDACVQAVFNADPYCCNTTWDGFCAGAYNPGPCSGPPPCVAAPVPNDACYNNVITADPYCCNTAWDAVCQSAYDACITPPCVAAPVPNDACYNNVIAADPYCCNTAWDGVCQAAYDACMGVGAGPCASITPLIGCGASVNASMSGTGAGWNINSCGFTTPGTEMIFSFTPTASGIHTIDVTLASGGFVDFFWADAAGGCSSGAAWNCISDVFSTGNYGSMNWVAGQTYYILLDPEGTGAYSFTFDVDCPNPGGAVTAGDCASAIPVCTDLSFAVDPNGFGLVDELCTACVSNPSTNPSSANSGCLNSGELNSTWLVVNVATGGTLEYSFGVAGGPINCYDWIMWPYDAATCPGIIGNTLSPVSCNWNFPCAGYTGMSASVPAGGDAGNFEPAMNVSSGDQYIICFSNYSSALTTVPLNFFGTADVSCTPLPVELMTFSGTSFRGYNELHWSTGTEINNSHFDVERSESGADFVKIGTQSGAGTTLELSEYMYQDLAPVDGINYYRLKQVDFNGAYKYSSTIAVAPIKQDRFSILSAFPNPTEDVFNLSLLVPENDMFKIVITTPNGAIVKSLREVFVEGSNLIEIPVNNFEKGIYLVKIMNERTQNSEVIKLSVK